MVAWSLPMARCTASLAAARLCSSLTQRVVPETHASQHDLRQQGIVRKDRQNFEVVLRACSPRTRAAIAAWGANKDQDVKGTVAWLEIIHLYLLAFFGRKVTMSRRFELL